MTLNDTRPILVTGAGGFIGGHVARELASRGDSVRGFCRTIPPVEAGDPPISWIVGDLRDEEDVRRGVEGVQAIVHTAGWVDLGRDPQGLAKSINVDATRALLSLGERAGVERFVYTSTLWTVAAGTSERPADEDSLWDLEIIRSPYSESKREAERLVLDRNGERLKTMVLCPSLVIGRRDRRPTSTKLLLTLARHPLVFLPNGGIPIADVRVVARAHAEALIRGDGGKRYVIAGPYVSYRELARLVAKLAGNPKMIVPLADWIRRPLLAIVDRFGLQGEVSRATVGGGFLRLNVSGARADRAFDLIHPPLSQSLFETLEDHRRSSRAPWLQLAPEDSVLDGPAKDGRAG